MFGVILGTGCGGGIVVDGQVHRGPHGVAGEWGHNPLPWPDPDEIPGPPCWCGKKGCLETWVAGPALARDCDGPGALDASRHSRPRRRRRRRRRRPRWPATPTGWRAAWRQVINLLDPDVIVLGGGLSNMAHLYTELPQLLPRHVFSDVIATPILPRRARRFVRRARRRVALAGRLTVPALCRDCLSSRGDSARCPAATRQPASSRHPELFA